MTNSNRDRPPPHYARSRQAPLPPSRVPLRAGSGAEPFNEADNEKPAALAGATG